MTYGFKPFLAGAILAASLTPLGASAATDNAMSLQTVPCSQAAVAMRSAMHGDAMHGDAMKGDAMKGDAMKGDATESVDKMYATMAAEQTKTLMDMAKLEMRCGSDAKAKASAQSALPDLQQILTTLRIF